MTGTVNLSLSPAKQPCGSWSHRRCVNRIAASTNYTWLQLQVLPCWPATPSWRLISSCGLIATMLEEAGKVSSTCTIISSPLLMWNLWSCLGGEGRSNLSRASCTSTECQNMLGKDKPFSHVFNRSTGQYACSAARSFTAWVQTMQRWCHLPPRVWFQGARWLPVVHGVNVVPVWIRNPWVKCQCTCLSVCLCVCVCVCVLFCWLHFICWETWVVLCLE